MGFLVLFLLLCIYKYMKIKSCFQLSLLPRLWQQKQLLAHCLCYISRQMGTFGRGEDATELYDDDGGRKEGVLGLKIRAFHSHTTQQRLIHCTEAIITKSGVLFRERGFIYGAGSGEKGCGDCVASSPAEF